MSILPVISGEEAVKCFEKLGYIAVRQKESHIRMKHYDRRKKPLTIPRHKVPGKGLLKSSLGMLRSLWVEDRRGVNESRRDTIHQPPATMNVCAFYHFRNLFITSSERPNRMDGDS